MTQAIQSTTVSIDTLNKLADFARKQSKSIDELVTALVSERSVASGKNTYEVNLLGTTIGADSLPDWIASVIDHVDLHWPDALNELAKKGTWRGAHISRDKMMVHYSGRTSFVVQSKSGWYANSNIGLNQAKMWLCALCVAAGWSLGNQLKIVAPPMP
ncbi:MAG: hypothetical protein RL186_143 [Pseudomonadota bacterium]|jgi:hypothetical protein